jgi:dTMP kinase
VALLERAGIACTITKQPSDWYRSIPLVRQYLDTGVSPLSSETLALLAAADRMMHIETTVEPLLRRGTWVLSNRYVYSSYGFFKVRGADADFVVAVNSRVPKPDFGILIHIDPETAVRRVAKRDKGNVKFEEKDFTYLKLVQEELLRVWPPEFCVVDGMRSVDEVRAEIAAYVMTQLQRPPEDEE